MTLPDLWSAPQWLIPAIVFVVLSAAALIWSYVRHGGQLWFCIVAAACKITAIVLLAICLLEPMLSTQKPRRGANLLLLLADSSQSLQLRDAGQRQTREQMLRAKLTEQTSWQDRLDDEFDVRRYTFDRQLQSSDFADYRADGIGSSIIHSLQSIAQRYRERPQAGTLLLTDGNATDVPDVDLDWSEFAPVYPVVVGGRRPARDIGISRFSVSQTNFESAPVNISAELRCQGYDGKNIVAQLLDEAGEELDRQSIAGVQDDRPFALRFQLRPEKRGINVYRVRVFEEDTEAQFDDAAKSREATLVNNERLVLVDRAKGPYRVLYVAGRPNWEFKFLRRALLQDDEIDMIGLLRIAKREPKFTFRGHIGERTNPLFRGFENEDEEQAEQYDEPVLIRLGTKDAEELRNGFPKSAEELFQYHAVILDDVEANYFDETQKSLIQEFVSARGGGLLMLGGQESFSQGKYDRTPIGELLPVYLNRSTKTYENENMKLSLTRDGWLQPWVRIKSTEDAENERLQAMPRFRTLNPVQSIKPGASIMASVENTQGQRFPALVVQRFGKGRVGALLIGDLWRWHLNADTSNDDLLKSWRQTVRWLVADVPRPVDTEIQQMADANLTVNLKVTVNDEAYRPLDNATVTIDVTKPDGQTVQLSAQAMDSTAGQYSTRFVPRESGAYRARVTAKSADGKIIGDRQVGWVTEPANDEFQTLTPNRELMQRIAKQTGGEVIELDGLDRFAASLPGREVPLVETKIYPWWHTWYIFLLAVGLLIVEWGLRRWRGLP